MISPGMQGTCRPSGPRPGSLQIVLLNSLNSLGHGMRSWAVSISTSFALQTRSAWFVHRRPGYPAPPRRSGELLYSSVVWPGRSGEDSGGFLPAPCIKPLHPCG
ncbi:hypothetical protein NPIL_275991 [Nephila pilipes]|uniref:Uncharacterized protein n=1 Tax=Nephila pilipes TaxID=299642 RepID=A0A8X6MI90_NEPPI|nr:hypothetical protein NPIL_677251 [Nephila pilipes]GFS72381.1 hypothetical protein NPIL_389191 [Nephila pilipes]GFT35226.1 hypothetical protein NPIL_563361 [Nephila pilipes]GFU26126.1 hypothetical protein NPIL_275991 [Nephila pilipes]